MDKFLTSTFTLEVLLTGPGMMALGFAGVMVPVFSEVKSDAPSAAEIDLVAEARIARLRGFLNLSGRK